MPHAWRRCPRWAVPRRRRVGTARRAAEMRTLHPERRGPSEHRGPATPPEQTALLPHIRQFVSVRQALVRAEARHTTVTALLDNHRIGVVHLDRRGRIMEANGRARDILRRGDGVSDRGGALRARVSADRFRLEQLVGDALPSASTTIGAASTTNATRVTTNDLRVLMPSGPSSAPGVQFPELTACCAHTSRGHAKGDPQVLRQHIGFPALLAERSVSCRADQPRAAWAAGVVDDGQVDRDARFRVATPARELRTPPRGGARRLARSATFAGRQLCERGPARAVGARLQCRKRPMLNLSRLSGTNEGNRIHRSDFNS